MTIKNCAYYTYIKNTITINSLYDVNIPIKKKFYSYRKHATEDVNSRFQVTDN